LRDISQCRRFESAGVFRFFRNREPPDVRFFLVHPDPDVVILLIGEQNSIVAVVTFDRLENIPAANRTLTHRALVAGAVTVPRSVAADDRSLVGGYGLHHVLGRRVALKHFLKLLFVSLQCVYLCNDLARLLADGHVPTGPCSHGLLLERAAAPVPVKLFVISDVPKRRAAARECLVSWSNRLW